jgi:hypothetical protein
MVRKRKAQTDLGRHLAAANCTWRRITGTDGSLSSTMAYAIVGAARRIGFARRILCTVQPTEEEVALKKQRDELRSKQRSIRQGPYYSMRYRIRVLQLQNALEVLNKRIYELEAKRHSIL